MSIALIRQKIISLAIRNYSFRHPLEGRLTFRDISPVVIRTKRVNLLHRLCTKPTQWRNQTRSLVRKDRGSIFLTTANKEGRRQWLWQASIFFSWLIQSSYSGLNPLYYPLPSIVQNKMRCCLEFIFNIVFECKWATNLFRCKFVDRWIRIS